MYMCVDAFSYCINFNITCCVATCSLLYVIHVASPSAELVKRVRELYTRNSSDVRFLIPVLHGLQKVGSLSHIKRLVCRLPLLKSLAPTARVIQWHWKDFLIWGGQFLIIVPVVQDI